MIGLLQRVSEAAVSVGGADIAAIGRGLLVLVGVERGDDAAGAARLAERLLGYRVFPDNDGRMNLDVTQIGGEVLLVPQFTLAADTAKGRRPSFGSAAPPEEATDLFDALVAAAAERWRAVKTGRFRADMAVRLVNDGPVTFWLRVVPPI
ncbi:MAG TPA: D-aminoacyl-tRNA deacylase [Gammaproteobacteria bacterium]|jgi:D-tyrosyl-tRNA(Tyr) deacylase|nr:D-aminoacyl-tRNA deacylase [Gammaproteobacteria bacterium]